jgi:hypothetical protein
LGDELLWTKAVDREIVLAMRARDRRSMQRRRIDGSRRWWVDYAPTDEVDVADDCTSLAINGVTFTLPGQLHDAELWQDCVIVLVYPNAHTGPRNLYRYNYDGTQVWQVEERSFQTSIPYETFSRKSASVIKGAGYELDGTRLVSAMGALIDYQSGEVIAQEDPR